MKYSIKVKKVLQDKINELATEKVNHVKNPSKDFTRDRKLNFPTMIHSILCMGASSLKDELLQQFNYDPSTVTTSAFVQQRDKIKSSAFESLFHRFNQAFPEEKLYRGYRLLGIDGSSLSIFPDPKDMDNYRKDRSDIKGFSHLHLNACYDLLTRRYVDIIVQSGNKANERLAMKEMIKRHSSFEKTIFIADRGYENYNNFFHIQRKKQNYLIRVKDRDSNGILSGLVLPDEDEFDIDVDLILTRRNTNLVKDNPHLYKFMPQHQVFEFMDENKECPISFRVVRIKLTNGSYQAIITNLCRDTFSPEEISKLYGIRWGIESAFRHLKYVVGMNCFHAKKVDSIKQEIFARLIVHNFCEIITAKVVIQKKDTKHHYQLNFTRAFRICRQFLRFSQMSDPPDVEKLLLKELLPIRTHRISPRKVKTRSSASSFLYRVS
jgi:hypothetical protein